MFTDSSCKPRHRVEFPPLLKEPKSKNGDRERQDIFIRPRPPPLKPRSTGPVSVGRRKGVSGCWRAAWNIGTAASPVVTADTDTFKAKLDIESARSGFPAANPRLGTKTSTE